MAPSSPLVVKMVGMERRQLSWQRGRFYAEFNIRSQIGMFAGLPHSEKTAVLGWTTSNLQGPMTNKPLLTIAIPTYNRERLLDICLDSIVGQVRECPEDIEVLISNNASTDNTRDVATRYLDIYPKLRYTENQVNRGMDFNFAKCFELARAEYVWIFSDDDLLLPRAIERIVPLLKTQNLGIVTLAVNFYSCKGSIDKTLFP